MKKIERAVYGFLCMQHPDSKTSLKQGKMPEQIKDPKHRYASFDYCYNHFHPKNFDRTPFDMEKSCMILGLYLASWGMYRGSSFLLQETSPKHFVETIEYINEKRSEKQSVWDLDVNKYDENTYEILEEVYRKIHARLKIGDRKHLTLVTKTMLGVFGIVPAFDERFCATFSSLFPGECGFAGFKKSLKFIHKFYERYEDVIDELAKTTKTVVFDPHTKLKSLKYTRAKIIDMCGFMGLD